MCWSLLSWLLSDGWRFGLSAHICALHLWLHLSSRVISVFLLDPLTTTCSSATAASRLLTSLVSSLGLCRDCTESCGFRRWGNCDCVVVNSTMSLLWERVQFCVWTLGLLPLLVIVGLPFWVAPDLQSCSLLPVQCPYLHPGWAPSNGICFSSWFPPQHGSLILSGWFGWASWSSLC